jgi:hypothetical protein
VANEQSVARHFEAVLIISRLKSEESAAPLVDPMRHYHFNPICIDHRQLRPPFLFHGGPFSWLSVMGPFIAMEFIAMNETSISDRSQPQREALKSGIIDQAPCDQLRISFDTTTRCRAQMLFLAEAETKKLNDVPRNLICRASKACWSCRVSVPRSLQREEREK